MWSIVGFISIVATSCTSFDEKDMICTEEFCAKYIEKNGCPELSEACLTQNSTHNGVYLPYPGTCNCCTYCITNLGLNESCISGSPGMLPPSTICGPGLSCTGHPPTCQPMETACTNKQAEWDDRRANGTLGMTQVRPKCDDDGMFLPAHCVPGFSCYCLSPEGDRIFGETPFLNPSDEHGMLCGCSLNHRKALLSVNSDFADIALAARCNDHGLYDPLQCMMGNNSDCYCVDPISGDPRNEFAAVPISELKLGDPPCFDPSIHDFRSSGVYESECEMMQKKWREGGNAKITHDAASKEFTSPKCQPDGKFRRVQILGEKKICVDPDGRQIDDFQSSIEDPIDCNCARTLWLLRKADVVELPSCDVRGSFEPRQTRRNDYFCVDCNGDQIGVEIDGKDKDELSCSYVTDPCNETHSSFYL